MSAKRNRMLELRVIDALRGWSDPAAPTIRSLAKAVNHPHMLLADVVRQMQFGGILHLNSLRLTANYLVANDATEEVPVAEISGDDGAAGGSATPPPAAEVEPETAPAPLPAPVAVAGVTATGIALPADDATGAEWGQVLRDEALARGVHIVEFVRPLFGSSSSRLYELERSRCPRPGTRDRIRAFLTGVDLPAANPPKPVLGVMPSVRVRVVYEAIRAIANEGGPCPKNRELAVAAGCMESAVPTLLLWLRDNGWLVLEKGRALKERRFYVPETGQRTDWPAPDEKMGEAKAAPSGALEAKDAEAADIAARRDAVERDRAEALRAATRAEAEALGRNRKIAGTVGGGMAAGAKLSVPPPPRDSYGAAFQAAFMADGPGSAAGVLRAAWPEDLRLLERIAQAHGERPVPMLVRLIRAEARRLDIRRRDALPDDGAWWVTGTANTVDGEFDAGFGEEGMTIHG